ncbi:MAG: glycerol-3-phosphate cytidylyltransferase [Bacteroidetes bacterium GWA2_30_7]|nr:MAG: glycerol-3-phosphate cytidylyltransferase [Bacteroidetes bacterium GWA2_30_7]
MSAINVWKFKDNKIVFTNGCFDILHRGHIEYLAKAASLGNKLVIGLNTDESVRKNKGKNRPVQDEYSRALILSSLKFVDAVILFNETTPDNLIKLIKPDFLVKGGDYKVENIVGSGFVNSYGGQVVVIEYLNNFSSSSIITKI